MAWRRRSSRGTARVPDVRNRDRTSGGLSRVRSGGGHDRVGNGAREALGRQLRRRPVAGGGTTGRVRHQTVLAGRGKVLAVHDVISQRRISGGAAEVVSAGLLSTCHHAVLTATASEAGNDIAGQGGRGSQRGRELVRAQQIPTLRQSAGLQLPDNLMSALLKLLVRPGVRTSLPEVAVVSFTVQYRGVKPNRSSQAPAFRARFPRTCMRCPAEQGCRMPHRVERAGSLAAQPVVPGHGVRVQSMQPLLAFAYGRGGSRVDVGVRRGGAPGTCYLEQIGLDEPPRIMCRCPAGPRQLPGGTFLIP